jgi:hypothetical protein
MGLIPEGFHAPFHRYCSCHLLFLERAASALRAAGHDVAVFADPMLVLEIDFLTRLTYRSRPRWLPDRFMSISRTPSANRGSRDKSAASERGTRLDQVGFRIQLVRPYVQTIAGLQVVQHGGQTANVSRPRS